MAFLKSNLSSEAVNFSVRSSTRLPSRKDRAGTLWRRSRRSERTDSLLLRPVKLRRRSLFSYRVPRAGQSISTASWVLLEGLNPSGSASCCSAERKHQRHEFTQKANHSSPDI